MEKKKTFGIRAVCFDHRGIRILELNYLHPCSPRIPAFRRGTTEQEVVVQQDRLRKSKRKGCSLHDYSFSSSIYYTAFKIITIPYSWQVLIFQVEVVPSPTKLHRYRMTASYIHSIWIFNQPALRLANDWNYNFSWKLHRVKKIWEIPHQLQPLFSHDESPAAAMRKWEIKKRTGGKAEQLHYI